ncbi:Histidine kinase [Pseudodesulfovibrio profundus]|uniref:histidine kinase n=1 Tax=Pseudodesulfovibrio profundus TaxID=57320 RepID=A0A2C8FD33_9BACT|nr:PAS domain-containing sensor histidine kinase [Pseudodesulfovibrio profundus]MBC16914.1 two-component sensor histidine kinase [Desulfovibrio sp.]SOB60364.1 Histidine kinase [Pseudodesulfovibrio profundus]|tara:strand:- start:13406 stop:15136 length:1731 start_codon:yes stop_codon:yes gene_type:complete
MSILEKIRPQFWDTDASMGPGKSLFNYRRIWRFAIALLAVVALVPLCVMAFIDYNVTRHSMESENLLRTARTTSNTRRTVAFFLQERQQALEFLAFQQGVQNLRQQESLEMTLKSMQSSFGGLVDLGLIDAKGSQIAYAGPYDLLGLDYSQQQWFERALQQGEYVSHVFRGFRDEPHLVIAHKVVDEPSGKAYVLRATLDTEQFNAILSSIDLPGDGDAFIVDQDGMIQTPSKQHGELLAQVDLPIPEFSEKTSVRVVLGPDNTRYYVGYAYVRGTPFIVMVVKNLEDLMKPLQTIRMELLWILATSVAIILIVIVGVATYMVNKIYIADQTRARTLHRMEHTNRMASIGRLAAGVAHEINNPLAIINEKAGLINDLFTYKQEYAHDERLLSNIRSIIDSVSRCGKITKRLLSFARHIDVEKDSIQFKGLAEEVIDFLRKEAEYRSISIVMDIPANLPEFISDRGKLQQIFLNLVNNAFQAMNDGGELHIAAKTGEKNTLVFTVADDGCGIPSGDIKRIFDPFFSTKKRNGGTGLGLSITYGLVQELGGSMFVESEVGRGSVFTITMPIEASKEAK